MEQRTSVDPVDHFRLIWMIPFLLLFLLLFYFQFTIDIPSATEIAFFQKHTVKFAMPSALFLSRFPHYILLVVKYINHSEKQLAAAAIATFFCFI